MKWVWEPSTHTHADTHSSDEDDGKRDSGKEELPMENFACKIGSSRMQNGTDTE